MRRSLRLVAAGLVLAALGCADGVRFGEELPPAGGTYQPGTGGAPSGGSGASYGSGAAYGTGSGGDAPVEPPPCAEELRRCAHVFALPFGGEQSVEVRGDFAPDGWVNGVPMALVGDTWEASVAVPWNAPVAYKLVVDGATWITDPGNPAEVPDGLGGFNSVLDGVTCEAWTCAPPVLGSFDWRDAVLYFVFVDRFANGDASNDAPLPGVDGAANYQGGDWAGVRATIESGYFESLGVNALWLSVPFDNTEATGVGDDGHPYSAYHGYWPRDLDATEARFGSLAELVGVVDAAHAHGLKVVVDYAMNHVHVSSPVYAQHGDWFWPLDWNGKHCVCGGDCSWDGSEGKRCWFRDYLPDFDFTVPAARDYSVGNAIQWIQATGIDGFRLDAVKHIEDAWVTELRHRVTTEIESVSGQHFYLVGETFTGDRGTIAYYVEPSTKLDGQFDFPLRNAVVSQVLMRQGSMYDLDGFLGSNDGYYGAGIMSTFVGNHDVPRAIHFAADSPAWGDPWASGKDRAWQNQPGLPGGMSAFERLANGFAILFTLPGVPLVYYGDEVGMPGAGDPDNRRFMPWQGYSAGQTFLRDRVAKLAAIRAAHPALRRGTRTTVSVTGDTLCYRMATAGDAVFVAVNRGDGAATVNGLPAGSYVDEVDGSAHGAAPSVPARSTRILVAQ
ncbi:MAG: hypothetical protein HY908_01080 [Myxococcales bacterium]|nr:hypothetical protein [Myxococcales bacterium]